MFGKIVKQFALMHQTIHTNNICQANRKHVEFSDIKRFKITKHRECLGEKKLSCRLICKMAGFTSLYLFLSFSLFYAFSLTLTLNTYIYDLYICIQVRVYMYVSFGNKIKKKETRMEVYG